MTSFEENRQRDASVAEVTPTPPSTSATTSPSSSSAPVDLWQSIRTIIELQNQAPPLVPTAQRERLPLSFTQERLWLLEQLNPGTAAYNIPFAFRIQGALNIDALEASLRTLLERHTSLRTRFPASEGQATQCVDPVPASVLLQEDLRGVASSEKEAQMMRRVTVEAQTPFNLETGPVFRARLFQLDDTEFALVLTVHHIVFDGWSEGVLFKELAALYEALAHQQPVNLPDLPVQYADVTLWQRQWLQGEFLETLTRYWRSHLNGHLSELQLPSDRPRPAVQTRQSACESFTLPAELTAALKTLSRQEKATLFPTLLAAFFVVLHTYTQQDRLFVCTPTANRNRSELKNLIGYFVNLLILQGDLSSTQTFRDLLAQVRQTASGASAHQDLPVQLLMEALDGNPPPLSQVMVALQNTPQQTLNLAGLDVSALEVDSGTADFDLFLSLTEANGTLNGVLTYNTDLFDAATINTLIGHFRSVLEQIVVQPQQSLATLLPLTDAERNQLDQKRAQANAARSSKASLAESVPPATDTERQLVEIWKTLLGLETVGTTDNFFELGGQSLLAVRLFTQIEQTFGTKLPLTTLLQSPTIQQLAHVLDQGNASQWQSLVPFKTGGSKPPFFCVPPAGCTVVQFTDLANTLEADYPFYGLQHLGTDGEQTPHNRVEDMAAYYIKEIKSVQPHGPYCIGGRCFGGVIAFEMACQLKAQGDDVGLLAILDTQIAPQAMEEAVQTRTTQTGDRPLPIAVVQTTIRLGRRLLRGMIRPVTARPTPTEEATIPHRIRHVWDAHKAARLAYTPSVYPGPITLFVAEEPANGPTAYKNAWAELARDGLECVEVSGTHASMFVQPAVSDLAHKLSVRVDRVQESSP